MDSSQLSFQPGTHDSDDEASVQACLQWEMMNKEQGPDDPGLDRRMEEFTTLIEWDGPRTELPQFNNVGCHGVELSADSEDSTSELAEIEVSLPEAEGGTRRRIVQ